MAETVIYLDHAATTPVAPAVLEAMLPWLHEGYGNPGSLHRIGRRARQAVREAREQVAALIGAEPREIHFSSGGTESDNLALAGILEGNPGTLVTSPTEHHAVLHTAHRCASHGATVYEMKVDQMGCVDLAAFRDSCPHDARLVSLMHGNNETGVLQPVEEVARWCFDQGIAFHSDAVQSVAHVPIDVRFWPVSMLTLSAHKLGGPKGVGALFVRKGTVLTPQITGGGQERKLRAGTENVAGIVGFGLACELVRTRQAQESKRLALLGVRLQEGIISRIPDCQINGGDAPRLPHIVNIGFAGVEGEGVLYGLDAENICVSTGSACTAGVSDPSHVLRAMGQSHGEALSAVRFSLGVSTTEADIDRVLNVLPRVIQELRAH